MYDQFTIIFLSINTFLAMPTVDRMRERAPGPGVYRVVFHNETAWIRSLDVCYRVVFEDDNGEEISFTFDKSVVA